MPDWWICIHLLVVRQYFSINCLGQFVWGHSLSVTGHWKFFPIQRVLNIPTTYTFTIIRTRYFSLVTFAVVFQTPGSFAIASFRVLSEHVTGCVFCFSNFRPINTQTYGILTNHVTFCWILTTYLKAFGFRSRQALIAIFLVSSFSKLLKQLTQLQR